MAKSNLNPILKWEGKSFLLNSIMIVLNLLGLTLVVIGSHASSADSSGTLLWVGYVLMLLSICGLVILKGRLMMSSVSRVLVGGLFIVSGLVKANDPIGFSYKLEEYFEDGALAFRIKEWFGMPEFSLEVFMEWALPLSVIICIFEIVLGVLTILGRQRKLTSTLIVLMMAFFTFLTWHTANCDPDVRFTDRDTYLLTNPIAKMKMDASADNPEIQVIQKTAKFVMIDELKQPQCVDDCGCFGDALKGSVGRSLTPSESLWKDLVLLYLSLWLLMASFKRGRFQESKKGRYVIFGLLLILFLCYVFGWYFPFVFGLLSILGAAWVMNSPIKYLNNDFGATILITALCILMVTYVLRFEPIKDYRPYAVGTSLPEKMNDGINGVTQSLLVYKNIKTEAIKEWDAADPKYAASKIWENKDWVYESMTQKVVVPMRIPSITDQFSPFLSVDQISDAEMGMDFVKARFAENQSKGYLLKDIENDYTLEVISPEYSIEDYPSESYLMMDTIDMMNPEFSEINLRDYIVSTDRIYVLISKNLKEAHWEKMAIYKELFESCKKSGIPMVLLSSTNRNEMDEFRSTNKWAIPMFINDETELKAISRSNPALLYIEKGVVKAKYAHRSTPSVKWMKENLEQQK
jgi:uncharacterized membrane protein YphA (DoxX/SURF4 family)